MDEPTWTLRELIDEVGSQLARNYEATGNGQVRAIPDERSVRYYTSLGLIDRPAAMRGRTALYGRRHLAQLVAIKRLQALDKSLSEIQQTMATIDDATLSRVSGVVLPRTARARPRASFWRDEPKVATATPVPRPDDGPFVAAWTLELAPGVTLTFPLARAPGAADASALIRAAQPLIDELARRQLAPTAPQENEA